MNDINSATWNSLPLGQIFDRSIAHLYKVPESLVRQARISRGIARPTVTGRNRLLALLLRVKGASVSWLSACLGRPEASIRRDLKVFERRGFVVKGASGWDPRQQALALA